MRTDYIKRNDAIKRITSSFDEFLSVGDAVDILLDIPSANVVERELYELALHDVIKFSVEEETPSK